MVDLKIDSSSDGLLPTGRNWGLHSLKIVYLSGRHILIGYLLSLIGRLNKDNHEIFVARGQSLRILRIV